MDALGSLIAEKGAGAYEGGLGDEEDVGAEGDSKRTKGQDYAHALEYIPSAY